MSESELISIPDRKELEEQYTRYRDKFEHLLYDLQHDFRSELKKISLHVTLKNRVKDFDSVYMKVLAKNIDFDKALFTLTDIMGLRIICPFMEDVKTVEAFIRNYCTVIEEERKGENLSFREFGYESIHFLIEIPEQLRTKYSVDNSFCCEVQIRTILQDAWAEVEHELVYKAEFSPYDEPLKRKLAALNANLSLSDIIFQEIRDYQRQLHAELNKRRFTFNRRVEHEAEELYNGQLDYNEINRRKYPDLDKNKFRKQSPIETGNIDNMLLEALYAHNEGDFDQAISIYTQILDMKPQDYVKPVIFVHRGMAFFGKSLYDLAEKDFSEALKREPENDKTYYYRGIVYSINENYTKALNDFNKSLSINPYQSYVFYSRAQVYFHIGDYPAAMNDCRSALSLRPDYPEAKHFRELIQSKMNF
ncbi:RelA/SpoT domain-containing protein [Spirochaeta isovalerica]|uniref:Putative GTP pyrophosphokinase n=1 Tax=Spirochaeta isovalerica TaxID=150 RepID=A0A841R9K7_9SPIO|nr:RelA/SpoT domain-containing protein [Spirochaeta isovalerica]MBB6479142.1 putative GTP pyrophosphokinase [Spirochaeta isovalerica]